MVDGGSSCFAFISSCERWVVQWFLLAVDVQSRTNDLISSYETIPVIRQKYHIDEVYVTRLYAKLCQMPLKYHKRSYKTIYVHQGLCTLGDKFQ